MHRQQGDLSVLLGSLSAILKQAFLSQHCTVFILKGRSLLHLNTYLETSDPSVTITSMPTNLGIPGCVVTTGQAVNISDTRSHPHYDRTLENERAHLDLQTLLSVPICLQSETAPDKRGAIVGVVLLGNKQRDSLSPVEPYIMEDQRSLEKLCLSIGEPEPQG